jgi:hypothetical protein
MENLKTGEGDVVLVHSTGDPKVGDHTWVLQDPAARARLKFQVSAQETPAVMKAYIIKIKSGEHAGRYLGPKFGAGLATNPEVQKNPPVKVPDCKYDLWGQSRAATRFFEQALPQVLEELTKLGYELEVVKLQG